MCIHFVSSLLLAAVGGVLCALSPLSVVAMSTVSPLSVEREFLYWNRRLCQGYPDAVAHFVRIGVCREAFLFTQSSTTGAEFAARLVLLKGAMDERVMSEQLEQEVCRDDDDEEPPLLAARRAAWASRMAARSGRGVLLSDFAAAAAAAAAPTTQTNDYVRTDGNEGLGLLNELLNPNEGVGMLLRHERAQNENANSMRMRAELEAGALPEQMPALHVFYYGKFFHIFGF